MSLTTDAATKWMINMPEKEKHALWQSCVDYANEKTKTANLSTEEERRAYYVMTAQVRLVETTKNMIIDAQKKTTNKEQDQSSTD